ncbi:MAG: GNAT family N-acetyltransferase [Pseudomonadota bacterium]
MAPINPFKHWISIYPPGADSGAVSQPDSAISMSCYESMAQLPSSCEALLDAASRDSYDLSGDWFRLLENKALPPERRLRIYVTEQHGKVRSILPFMLIKAKWYSQMSSLTNYYSSLYRPLLADTVTSAELAGALRIIVADSAIDRLRFDAMDIEHPTFEMLQSAIRQIGLRPYEFSCFGNWYLPVQNRPFQAYFQSLPSQVRNTVRRREKKFYAGGKGKLEIVSGADGLEKAITAWGKIYSASWKNAEPFPEFVPGLIRMCAAHNWLRLGIAYYDDEPVAAQIWIVNHGRAAIYKLAYDEKFAHLSAGTVLTTHLMRHALDEDKIHEADYLIGDDAYKKDWMSHRRERRGIIAYNTRRIGGIAGAAIQMCGGIVRQARIWLSTRNRPVQE